MIKRELAKEIIKRAKKYPVISVTGPRQSGKTTLIRDLFSDFLYANLESPDTREFASSDPRAFLNQSKAIVIDEIQRVPELLSYIQVFVDEDNSKKFVISGSQNLLVSEKISQSLAGRVFIANLFPLSLSELELANLLDTQLVSQIFKGFYPKIYNDSLEPSTWYKNYIQTYLERDVRNIKSVENLGTFQNFLGLLAGRTAQILNLTSISNDAGISVPTVRSWLSILEASYIIKLLPSYHTSWSKRIIKAPKIHFLDTGLVCALLNINKSSELAQHPLVGNLFESFIFSEFTKKKANFEINSNSYYWRDKTGREVDLILESDNTTEAIEVKYGQTINESYFANLESYKAIAKNNVETKVIYGGQGTQHRSGFTIQGWQDI